MTIAVVTVVVVTFFSKNYLTPPKPMRFLRAAFRDLAMFLFQGTTVLCEETTFHKIQFGLGRSKVLVSVIIFVASL